MPWPHRNIDLIIFIYPDTENSQAAAVAESNTEEAPMDVEDAATEATAAPLKSSTAAEEVVATETTTPKV